MTGLPNLKMKKYPNLKSNWSHMWRVETISVMHLPLWDEVDWSNKVLSKFIFFLLNAVLSKSAVFVHSFECCSFEIQLISKECYLVKLPLPIQNRLIDQIHSFEIRLNFERTAFERMYKNSAFWKNGIRKKKMNFERTLLSIDLVPIEQYMFVPKLNCYDKKERVWTK